MKAPLEWINEMTKIDLPVREFADRMTLSGSKVEGILIPGDDIKNVFSGKIVSVEDHPDSDHLHVCSVNIGNEDLQIVCGAPNVAVGMICPVAVVGAVLPGGIEIKKAKLRGVESFGMCCSVQELGFDPKDFPAVSSDGLWKLPENTPVGIAFADYLDLNETIDFEITSNRPDCFSIEGLAREAAVTLRQPFLPIEPTVREEGSLISSEVVKIDIMAPDLCFRYCARMIEDVHVGPSPEWMQKRLRAAGLRPINNIVDITNYVCIEMGQPMHAFDLAYLSANHIIVRKAENDETTVTLDGVKRRLDPSMLVIADEEKVCAIAGVMGSENSEVKDQTRSILFESATFHPISIRKTAMANGLRTEASSRYEKGLDPENASRALNRACQLVEILGCGKVSKGIIDVYPTKLQPSKIAFSPDKINKLLGTELKENYMTDLLSALGCVFGGSKESRYCQAPTHRPDLECLADIAEEVARFYDYNNIQPTLLSGKQTTLGGRTREQQIVEKMKDVFVSQGYYEAITYSFESPKEADRLLLSDNDPLRKQVVIQNPLGEDFSVMRSSMVPSMLRIAGRNASRSVSHGGVFEIAYVYLPSEKKNTLPEERQILSAILFDANEDYLHAGLFYQLKGAVEALCLHLGIKNLQFRSASDIPYFHPGRVAEVLISGEVCGHFGYIHPDVAGNYQTPKSTAVLALDVSTIIAGASEARMYSALPKFPGITRDLAVKVSSDIPVGDLKDMILAHGGKFLESCELFDVYCGKQIEENTKSVAFNLLFRSSERTLNDADIVDSIDEILNFLSNELGARLR